jgi:2-oxo-4-hydroxy-4-carboxy-5-ureidoimidazoline decarboxylase
VTALERLNTEPAEAAQAELLRCCGCRKWANAVVARRPFEDPAALLHAADDVWAQTSEPEWREAMTHHPRIGDVSRLREKFAATATWSSQEQKGVGGASEETLHALAEGNRAYEARHGFIFLVCASGKSADEMLALLQSRMNNPSADELRIAAGEQAKITRIRLEKLLSP